EDVGPFGDLLGGGLAGAVAGTHVDADQRRARRIDGLQGGGELETVRGEYAVVVVAGGDQEGRVVHAFTHVVQRRVGAYGAEFVLIEDAAVVAFPGPADGEFAEAQHVEHADAGHRGGEQVRALHGHGGGQQAAVGTAMDGQVLRCSVA